MLLNNCVNSLGKFLDEIPTQEQIDVNIIRKEHSNFKLEICSMEDLIAYVNMFFTRCALHENLDYDRCTVDTDSWIMTGVQLIPIVGL